jgi:hypothetical protein
MSMPVENPGARSLTPLIPHIEGFATAAGRSSESILEELRKAGLLQRDGADFSFADTPENRGLGAVLKELRPHRLSDDQRQAMIARLLHFGEVFRSDALKPWIKPGTEPGVVDVSEALIKACATARFVIAGGKPQFDVADIARIATQYDKKEDAAK